MHVSGFYCIQGQGCPGSTIQIVAIVQPDYLDVGNYDIKFYRGNMAGPWTQVARVTGWANPLGGEFNVVANVQVAANPAFPRWYYGAQDAGEPAQGLPQTLDWSAVAMDPDGAIVASPASGQAPLYVSFHIEDHNGSIETVQWQFGDGGSGTGSYVNHTFNQAGNYTVRAVCANECERSIQLTKTISVAAPTCTSPYGTDGQTTCVGTTQKKCQGGNWVTIQENATQCGYTPPPTPCSSPYGQSGDTRCDGTTLKQCVNGQWVTTQSNAPQCGGGSETPCSNPYGANGTTRCDGTTKVKCQNGSWVTVETNSEDCGYVPPGSEDPCSDPYGEHGTFGCEGSNRVQCQNGDWVVVYQNSPLCTGQSPCTNPSGAHGATRCNGTTLMECQNGTWAVKKTNSTECGYVPPSGEEPASADNTILIIGVAAVAAVGIGALAHYLSKKR